MRTLKWNGSDPGAGLRLCRNSWPQEKARAVALRPLPFKTLIIWRAFDFFYSLWSDGHDYLFLRKILFSVFFKPKENMLLYPPIRNVDIHAVVWSYRYLQTILRTCHNEKTRYDMTRWDAIALKGEIKTKTIWQTLQRHRCTTYEQTIHQMLSISKMNTAPN